MPLAKRRSKQENVFTTNNIHQNQKFNRMDQNALILTQGLTTATLQCTVKPLFFFLLTKPHQSTAKSITKTTTTNNPKSLNQKLAQNKHNKQLRKNAMFLNIKITQTATCFELTEIAPLIKTQYNRKKQNNRADTLR